MKKTINFVVEINETTFAFNNKLNECIRISAQNNKTVILTVIHPPQKNKPLANVFKSLTSPFEIQYKNDWPEEVDAYFPLAFGNKKLLNNAFQRGCKVFLPNDDMISELEWDDFFQGYIHNTETSWFAKVFPEPVIIARPDQLSLSLGCTINPRCIILNSGIDGVGGKVSLGRASHIGADALLNLGPTNFHIGSFSIISANFSAHSMRHSISHATNFSITKGAFNFMGSLFDRAEPISIANDVWIGEGVKCLPGVNIPNGCVIGAGSIVTSSLLPYGIYAGNPAKLIRFRFDNEKIEFLNQLEWWNYKFDYLKEIQEKFKCDISLLSIEELKILFKK